MQQSSQQLDQARRRWLAGLQSDHVAQGTAGSALALARGHWMCGDYEAAIEGFVSARDLAPGDPETQLSLIKAAEMVARDDLAYATLTDALQRFPDVAAFQLHAALREVPGDIGKARSRLQVFSHDRLCRQYEQALMAIHGLATPHPNFAADAQEIARIDSLRWVQQHASGSHVHTGFPAEVLLRALEVAPAEGLTLECGVYFGRSLRIIADRTAGQVHGFDSFQGLPEAWNAQEGVGAYSTAGRLPAVRENVTLHTGWFENSLPPFFAEHSGPIRLLHIDCDLYSSTRTVLAQAAPRLISGTVIVFDDMLGYPGYEQHELRAFQEFTHACGLSWELLAATLLGREVAIRVTSCPPRAGG